MEKHMHWIKIFTIFIFTSALVNAQDATSLYNEGIKLKEGGKSSAAIDKFKKAVQLKPGFTEALYEIGWCQNDLKDYSGAIETLRKVRVEWSNIPKLFFELGYAFEKTGLSDSAIHAYNKVIKLKPDYGLAYKQLGYIAYDKMEKENALMYFVKYEAAEESKGKFIENYLYWYRKGYCHNGLNQYEYAKNSLFKSLEYKKDYLNTYLEIGFACSKLKQNDDAITYFKKAIEVAPKSHIAYNGIGEVYRDNKKDMKESMNWYNKALEINPDERKANYGVGYCLNSLAKYNEAIPYLKKAIQVDLNYVVAFVELGYSYYKIEEDQLAEASFKKAIDLNNKNENSRYYLGLLFIRQNNKIKAQQMVNELKVLNSKNAVSLQEKIDMMN